MDPDTFVILLLLLSSINRMGMRRIPITTDDGDGDDDDDFMFVMLYTN